MYVTYNRLCQLPVMALLPVHTCYHLYPRQLELLCVHYSILSPHTFLYT